MSLDVIGGRSAQPGRTREVHLGDTELYTRILQSLPPRSELLQFDDVWFWQDWGEEHGDPRYILELSQRLVTVSLRTVDIVASLPPLNISSTS